jgi:aspartyl/asparaginyl-tRNA synthetase
MQNTLHFHKMVHALRHFFYQKGYIEVPAQSRLSILAACEQPESITQYMLGGQAYPAPQTGQMWLEYEILKNPDWPGVFCVTTSYRDEQNPIPGRHLRIFPMFEFEAHGTFDDLKKLERELLLHLGFEAPVSIDYSYTAKRYETETIEANHEIELEKEYGHAISLEYFPEYTHPFWNMKYAGSGLYKKIDILLHGMETIGSAERETDLERMRQRFFAMKDGEYAKLLLSKFDKERVLTELEEYLALPMIARFGGGIGLTRLERAMELSHLFEPAPSYYWIPASAPAQIAV